MGIIDRLANEFSKTNTKHIGQAVDELVSDAIARRRSHERRWFDNNFFDDGYHFRVVSRKTGRVIDKARTVGSYVERAIPRASRQIRATSNLLYASEPYPVVYPERITIENYRDKFTGEIDIQAYQQALEQSKQIARKKGMWISTEWEEQGLDLKIIDMLILAAKNSISWIQIYSDTQKQEILTDVYDAFDIIIYGDRRNHETLPFITKSSMVDLSKVMEDPRFKEEMTKKLTADNKYASSEIKEAYMRARYGSKTGEKNMGTIMLKETFIKEVLSDNNWKDAIKKGESNGALEGKSKGDVIMRQVYSAAGITLNDEYIDYDKYPLVPFRFEPGLLYQVPFIERFIPQNKSLDVIVTRLEKWVNAMVVGVYQKRKGENYQVSNFPGGQMIEYEATPLTQMQNASVGNTPFNVIELLNKYMDEQGATTAGGINAPQGVKSGVAIESIKATEYANLKISTLMLKKTIKTIAERMIERASKDYLEPKEVSYLKDGEPEYFDVIGSRGASLFKKINRELPGDTVSLDNDTKVRIEIEPGLGLTMQGKKEAMQQIIKFMIELSQLGVIPAESMKMVVKRFMEVFGYGSTQEFMETLEQAGTGDQVTEEQLKKMQIALLTALKDSGAVGPEMEKRLVNSTKVGVAETMRDLGMVNKKEDQTQQEKPPSKSISFKDLPPEGQTQLAAQAGIQLDSNQIRQDEMVKQMQNR